MDPLAKCVRRISECDYTVVQRTTGLVWFAAMGTTGIVRAISLVLAACAWACGSGESAKSAALTSVSTSLHAAGASENPADTLLLRPGEVWRDADNNVINAHGGGVLYYDHVYYWYGENKEGRTWLPPANSSWGGYRVDVTGVHAYSSKDLRHWKDEGLVLAAEPNDSASDLHPSKVVERPKVIFNAATKKFVMWMHIDSLDYAAARAGVAIADSPTGPFRYLESVRPEGRESRDQTVFQDDDGKAYRIYSSEGNRTTYISLLSDDYLKHTGRFVRAFVDRYMEGFVVYKRQGKYHLIASGCTGWDPNPARSAVADSIWGPWSELGNPCVGAGADLTFRAQSTFVFQVAGTQDQWVFMADRWNKKNLPDSRHVWLPLLFDNGRPKIEWHDTWELGVPDAASAP